MNNITAITEYPQTNKAVFALAFMPLRLSSLPQIHLTLAAGTMVVYVILVVEESNTLHIGILRCSERTIPIESKPAP